MNVFQLVSKITAFYGIWRPVRDCYTFPNSKWPNMRDEFALSPILTANQVTALRNLIALAYKIKCKWENKLKKGEVRKEGGQETVCIRNRWATK
jgi:hypothetical protein